MLSVAIAFCLVTGLGASCAAPYAPGHVEALESAGGMLMLAGLAMLGMALPA